MFHRTRFSSRRGLAALVVFSCGVAVVACGGDDESSESAPSSVAESAAAASTTASSETSAVSEPAAGTAYPLEIENCGRTLTFDAAPERIVGIDQISTEILLELGAAASVVGTANQSDPASDAVAGEFETVPVLAANYPTAEELVTAEPDFVVGNLEFLSFSQESGFGGPLTRDELDERGANSFALVCMGEEDSTQLLFDRVLQLGQILDAEEVAEAAIAEAQAALDTAADLLAGAEPVPTLIYIDGRGPIQTLGTDLADVGGANVLAPDEGGCCPPEIGIEAIAERDPAAVLVTSFGSLDPDAPTFENKTAALTELLPTVTAVQDERYLAIDFIAFSTPARIVHDVNTIGAFLHPDLDFPT